MFRFNLRGLHRKFNPIVLDHRDSAGESPGGGGRMQWFPFDFETGEPGPEIVMLTTDIAFIDDPDYRELVEEFARNPKAFDEEFAAAWYKLTTADMGPASRCTGGLFLGFCDLLPECSENGTQNLSDKSY